MEVGRLMQKSVQVKITVAKQDPRVCLKCGTALKPRGEKLTGRYKCPKCPEGSAEYIITSEFYSDLLSTEVLPKHVPTLADSIYEYYIVRTLNTGVKDGHAKTCAFEGKEITDQFCVSIALYHSHGRRKHLHLSCAREIGLKIEEVITPQ